MVIKVLDIKGNETGTVEIPKTIFSVDANPQLLAQYIRVYSANQRQGTASTKTRSQVIGSTKKIYRQKGTGKARHGDIKAPIFVGGGVVGGPTPRDYSLTMNKKQKKKALFYALTLKYKDNTLYGLTNESLDIESKTKIIAEFMTKMKMQNEKIIIIVPKSKNNKFSLACRNIANIHLMNPEMLNAYAVVRASKIFMVVDALPILEKHFVKNEN